MMSLWDALRMNMMISYQELVRTFPNSGLQYEAIGGIFRVFFNHLKNTKNKKGLKHVIYFPPTKIV
ncbi:hypothetical protein M8360_26155, partial [Klebsiella pneumoniae]|nr:hypothetical protein CVG30_03025 [Klebsiella pneumoniae subsp. pneumoniae]MCL7658954.1 hypothetical protein [Klebsiella pneumoniae]SWH76990.1 Uncharacterised protein [Klebsiella pneumoniae]SYL28295.1 Uncharacterised protein [Klebsiella pneumoniae]